MVRERSLKKKIYFQLINEEGVNYIATSNETMDLDNDHQWLLKTFAEN